MADQYDFTSDEWAVLNAALDAAGSAVLAANPDGAVKEVEGYLQAWVESTSQPFADGQVVLLLMRNRDALGEKWRFQAADEESISSLNPEQAKARAIELCRQAVAILAQKASPEELANYKQWVMFLCQRVAQSDSSGGFLGIGAKQISAEEKAVLSDIAAALG